MKSYKQLASNNYGNIMVTPMSDLIAKYGFKEPFAATYEESYKKRLELQLRFPIQTLAARLKYRGAALDYEKVPNMK